jgi:hypothetical protein
LTWKPRNSSDLRGLRSVATWMAQDELGHDGIDAGGIFPACHFP